MNKKRFKGDDNNVKKEEYFIRDNYEDDSYWKKEWALINSVLCRQEKILKDSETEIKLLNSYLIEKGLAEDYIRWKSDV